MTFVTWDFSTFCSACNLNYGTDLSVLGDAEKVYSFRCLNNAIDKVMMDDFKAFMTALVTSLAAHILVMYSIVMDRKVPESVIKLGFSRPANVWHLLAHVALFLDLAFEIADVVFITDLIWGDRDGGDEEGAGVDSSYIFSATDGYTSCEAKEVKEITAMVDLIRNATAYLLWERIIFSFFVVVCYHMGNNSSLKPSASELRRLQAGSPLPKKEKDEEGFAMI